MKNISKLLILVGIIFLSTTINAQVLPPSYESLFNEIVDNFKEIRGGNSIADGKTSLRLLSDEKIILRLDHKRKVKTLTFIIAKDEEGQDYWISANN